MHRPVIDVGRRRGPVALLLVADAGKRKGHVKMSDPSSSASRQTQSSDSQVLDAGLDSLSEGLHADDGLVGGLSGEVGTGSMSREERVSWQSPVLRCHLKRDSLLAESLPVPARLGKSDHVGHRTERDVDCEGRGAEHQCWPLPRLTISRGSTGE